jgi:hypothetical protein
MRHPAATVFPVSRKSLNPLWSPGAFRVWFVLALLPLAALAEIVYPAGPQLRKDGTVALVEDFAMSPLSSRTSTFNSSEQLSRLNFMRAEPTNAPGFGSRYFVCDLNRNLWIVPKTTGLDTNTWIKYIGFEEVFPRFDNDTGFAGGLNSFAFDPEYAANGIFYTVHMETTTAPILGPTNGALPGFDTNGYTTTTAQNPPVGSVARQAVLVEWRDTNTANTTFEGTAREILRVGFNSIIHPMGDLVFNPLAKPGDDDYRNLYIANGDGGAGESSSTRTIPQRLDALPGKILRITPDLTLRPADELSSNGRYRIPTTGTNANPFISVSLSGLRKEIWAYGFRNCHRLYWDATENILIESEIGLHSWEEVNIIHKGANYGYSQREGAEQLFVGGANNGKTGSQIVPAVPFPADDTLIVTGLVSTVTPTYPVALYSHEDGDAMSSGFVYRGLLMPGLRGKYIFGEIVNARLFYCDLAEMIASDDGDRTTVADIHELQLICDHPNDNPDAGLSPWRLWDMVAVTYTNRGGTSTPGQRLPGGNSSYTTWSSDIYGAAYGRGRADLRLALGDDDEIYLMTKTDGMIRKLTALLTPPNIQSIVRDGDNVALTWQSVPGWTNRVQFKTNLNDSAWNDLPGDVVATGLIASKTNAVPGDQRYYRVKLLVP